MNDSTAQAQLFERHRSHLRAVATRMLGAAPEADDAVQEAWLRFSGANADEVSDLRSWLTTVVARVCLDMLRSRKSRREDSLEDGDSDFNDAPDERSDPERDVLLADAMGPALLLVLDTLDPAERLAFVLHDLFAVSFDEIAPIVGRTPVAARKLASRARQRIQGGATPAANHARQREVVDAFLAASREGDFERLLAVLDPDVVLRVDQVAVDAAASRKAAGAPQFMRTTRGARDVANAFVGRAQAARPALVDGVIGAAYAPGGTPQAVFEFTVVGGKIVAIEVIASPDVVTQMEVSLLG